MIGFNSRIGVLLVLLLHVSHSLIIEVENGEKYCLSDLEKDHTSADFHVKFFTAMIGESDRLNVSVIQWSYE